VHLVVATMVTASENVFGPRTYSVFSFDFVDCFTSGALALYEVGGDRRKSTAGFYLLRSERLGAPFCHLPRKRERCSELTIKFPICGLARSHTVTSLWN
jgi:hypothetical protein